MMSTSQVHQHEGQRDDEDSSNDDRIVALADRLNDQTSDAGPAEHGFGHHGAAQQQAEVDAGHGDERQQRVRQHVRHDHLGSALPLAVGGAHVVLALLDAERRVEETQIQRQLVGGECERRQTQDARGCRDQAKAAIAARPKRSGSGSGRTRTPGWPDAPSASHKTVDRSRALVDSRIASPMPNASTIPSTNEVSANSSVAGRRSNTRSSAEVRWRSDTPKSPLTALARNFQYCTIQDWSSPSAVRSRAMSSSLASTGSSSAAGSPARRTRKKVKVTTPRTVRTD